jgi:hypothetical protein
MVKNQWVQNAVCGGVRGFLSMNQAWWGMVGYVEAEAAVVPAKRTSYESSGHSRS